MVTDENGQIKEEIGYLPFGALLFRHDYSVGQWVSTYRFTSQEYDSEYALYNYNARLYDPIMGRFITPDTVVPDWTNPQSLNRYAYCINNPLIYVDPSGHFPWLLLDLAVLGGAAIAAISGGNILQGALTGAISAAVFFVAGTLCNAAAASILGDPLAAIAIANPAPTIAKIQLAQAAIHAGAGVVSGGINAAITGGNVGHGMLVGGLSAGIAKYTGIDSLPGRMAFGAAVGVITAELSGGDFAQGAFEGAWTTAFAYVFNDYIHKGITYSDSGDVIGEVGIETPNPFLDPINYISGAGSGIMKWLTRPFYRYVGIGSKEGGKWLTRGWGWKPK